MIITIVIDSNEQLPYSFDRWSDQVYRFTDKLRTGDYSVDGYQSCIAVERKSMDDFFQSVGKGHKRFFDEVDRLAKMRFPLIVVETSLGAVLAVDDNAKSNQSRAQVLGSVIKAICDHGVPVIFAGSREAAEEITFEFLCKAVHCATRMGEVAPAYVSLMQTRAQCSLCGYSRRDAMKEHPGVGASRFGKTAHWFDARGKYVLGRDIFVCFKCQKLIKAGKAGLPPGYKLEKK